MLKKSSIILMLIVFLSNFLVGCWDKVEIEDRAYALAIAVDINDEAPDEEDELLLTFAIPNNAAIAGEADEFNILFSSTGTNGYAIMRRLGTRMNNELYLGHLKAVIISDEVARRPKLFREILDAMEKDPLISRKIYIALTEGKARKVLEVESELEPLTPRYIREIFEGDRVTNRAPLLDLNDIFYKLHRNGNSIITRLTPGETDVKAGGGGVIKDFQLTGWLEEEEIRGLMYLRDEITFGGYELDYKNYRVPVEITESKTSYRLIEEDGNISIIVDVTTEGDVRQFYFDPQETLLEHEILEALETMFEEAIEDNIYLAISALQEEHEVDLAGLDKYIHKYHPSIWQKIKDDYEDVFPEIDIVVNVDANIRRIGLTK
ncbi:Ger(x)C family spore germination protein [Serpentinicella sp. ANB-PHB4]|uniref:Ger(x)C family spore germination protein n=1 Tax=Serpentinicella sp. ANB-PHB4 TaxID=3074076 RepID=UPI00285CBFCE|nr:Ger(x)C family spore germination protein [Serpentinicella sp. ANB-PHB4]MDR5659131.1 Ger(x)C family spore germination protein [Serpentinicella sp. ANB-PHB4]